jgi:hypothetical protein
LQTLVLSPLRTVIIISCLMVISFIGHSCCLTSASNVWCVEW